MDRNAGGITLLHRFREDLRELPAAAQSLADERSLRHLQRYENSPGTGQQQRGLERVAPVHRLVAVTAKTRADLIEAAPRVEPESLRRAAQLL